MSYNTPSGSPFVSILGGLARGYQQRQQREYDSRVAENAKKNTVTPAPAPCPVTGQQNGNAALDDNLPHLQGFSVWGDPDTGRARDYSSEFFDGGASDIGGHLGFGKNQPGTPILGTNGRYSHYLYSQE